MDKIRRMFDPQTVALIGASEREGSPGRAIIENLLACRDRKIYIVNPNRKTVLDRDCYARVADVPDRSIYGKYSFILAAKADMPADALVRRLVGQIKLGAGSYNRVNGAIDTSGPLDEQKTFSYRLVGVAKKGNEQVAHTHSERMLLAPSLTWTPNEDSSLTLLAQIQRDDGQRSFHVEAH